MFELFKTKKNHFVGVDFGTSSIKVVELSYANQKINLENYGFADFSLQKNDNMKLALSEDVFNELLKKIIAKMGIMASMPANVSIPGFNGLITIIELPNMPDEELSKAIQFEAHKYIPSSLDEIAMSWEIIERKIEQTEKDKEKENDIISKIKSKVEHQNVKPVGRLKVLLVAAPKKDIERYDRLVSGVGLEVNAIELETFSIVRSLVGDESGTFLIVDIGSRATNIMLVEKGVIQVNRNIDAGGDEITSAIADGMNISRARAEIFKKGEKDIINGKESAIVVPVLDLIVGELRRIIGAYRAKKDKVEFEALIISGGTAKMCGMEEYFNKALNEKVKIGNPWRGISVNNEVIPLIKELGSSFSVALGLALRGIDDYKRK